MALIMVRRQHSKKAFSKKGNTTRRTHDHIAHAKDSSSVENRKEWDRHYRGKMIIRNGAHAHARTQRLRIVHIHRRAHTHIKDSAYTRTHTRTHTLRIVHIQAPTHAQTHIKDSAHNHKIRS